MNHWSRRSFIVLAAACAVGGFLMGKSASQDEVPPPDRRGAEGRFQLVASPNGCFIVFDTRTARGWARNDHGFYPGAVVQEQWQAISSPFDPRKENPGGNKPGDDRGKLGAKPSGKGKKAQESLPEPEVDQD
jgi:hypothetical protein